MSKAVAEAASRHAAQAALQAEAESLGISVGRLIERNARKKLAERQKGAGSAESLPGRTWRAMDIRTRTVLVMLASESAGDPRAYAGKAWEALTAADQLSIAACARELGRDLRRATCLF